jgi:hypothetical protein
MSHILCIVAGQRAGTTALQGALGSTGKFHNFGEIFHTEPLESSGTFLEFCRQRDFRVAEMATDSQARKVALDYLAYLSDLSGEQVPLLDVKLNSWHVIKPFWSYVHQVPFFMRVLLDKGAVFLLIRRRAILEQVLSEQIARAADKWHGLEDSDIPNTIRVNSASLAGQARLILQGETFILGCLAGNRRLIAIDYEDLYPDGFVNRKLLGALSEKLAMELPVVLKPSIRRNAPDKKRIVLNYDEASQAIDDVLKRYPRPRIANQITA